jgi:hypothetical protein
MSVNTVARPTSDASKALSIVNDGTLVLWGHNA